MFPVGADHAFPLSSSRELVVKMDKVSTVFKRLFDSVDDEPVPARLIGVAEIENE